MAGMDVDFDLLADFLAVAQEGTTIAAARARHVSQPALSARIVRLEKAVGATLFERGANGMRLTAAGQRFEPFARQALTALERGAAAARDGEVLRVGVVDDELAVVQRVLARLLPPVQVHRSAECDLIAKLRSGELDVIVGDLGPGPQRVRMELEEMGLAVPEGHRLAQGGPVDLAQTAHETHYLPRQDYAPIWVALVRQLFDEAGIDPKTYAVQSDSSLNPLRWVAAGQCVAVSLRSTPAPPGVVIVPIRTHLHYEWSAYGEPDNPRATAALQRLV